MALTDGGLAPGLDTPLAGEAPSPATSSVAASPRSPIQRTRYFGDYELLDEIGRGGMGIIYRARQISLNRLVALKLVRAGDLANEEEIARFRAEAAAAAQLDHPNIVPIHEVGEHEGRHYFSMKLLEGSSLAEHLSRNRRRMEILPPSTQPPSSGKTEPGGLSGYDSRAAARLVATIARAIHYAHQRRVLHRDLKPGNILLDGKGEPHITDFGLAKLLGQDYRTTCTHNPVGTPSYIAPEQAAGLSLTTGADVYGLGAILYELLCGRPPFVGPTLMETLRQVIEKEPSPPSRVQRRSKAEAISPISVFSPSLPDLDVICLKCLQKDPAHRYGSAEALAEDLERWLRHEPVQVRRLSLIERVVLWARRQPAIAALVLAVHLVATAGLVGILWQWLAAVAAQGETQRALSEKEDQVWLTSVNQARAERLTGLLGARHRALVAITNAARIRPGGPILRHEAIAALSMTDLQPHIIQSNASGVSPWVAFDPVQSRTVAASALGELIFSGLDTGTELFRLRSLGSPIVDHIFCPGGRWLCAMLADGRVAVWEVESQKLLWTYHLGPRAAPGDAAFHPVQPWLVVRSATNRLVKLRLSDGGEAQAFALPWDPELWRLSPDGQNLAMASEDRCAVWNVRRGTITHEVTGRFRITGMAWHPSGLQLAIGGGSGEILWWHLYSARQEIRRGEPQHVAAMDFDPSGSWLITGHWNSISQLWDVSSGNRLLTDWASTALRFTRNGEDIAVTLPGGCHGLWRMVSPPHLRPLRLPIDLPRPFDLAWSPDGRWIATIHADGVSLAGTSHRVSVSHHRAPDCGRSLAFSRDGQSILTASRNQFWRWKLAFNDETNPPAIGPPEPVRDSNPVPLDATAGQRGLGHLFPTDLKYHFSGRGRRFVDLATPDRLYELPETLDGALSLSRTTNWIAVYHPQGIQIRRLSGDPLVIPQARRGGLVLFSPDNRRLLHFSTGEVSAYDPETGQLKWRHPCTTPATMYPTFSPDSRTFAVGGTSSPQIWLFDGETGAVLATLTPTVTSQITGLAFSPDSQAVAVINQRPIEIWDLRALRRELAGMGLDWGNDQRQRPDTGELPPLH